MPFWKPESEHPSTLAFIPEHQPVCHIPPHISTGRRRLTHSPPGDDIIYHRNLDDADHSMAHNPKNSDNNPHLNIRNLRAAIAGWHVGTMPVIEERGSHLGQGQLRDSIVGPQYFRDSSNEPQQVNHPAVPVIKHETPEFQSSNDPIFINKLPCSHSRQQQIPNQSTQYGPPGGDPNDPDNPDNDGPPARGPPRNSLPGRGLPRGLPGNPNPWRPRMPGRPNGAPGVPPGRGPPGGGLPRGGPPGGGLPGNITQLPGNAFGVNDGFKFEKKIKLTDIPKWDGNSNMILNWINELNHISYRNQNIYYDLGIIAPLQLTDAMKRWFHALKPQFQQQIQQSWGEFKLAISTYFMNQQWFN